MVFLCIVAGLSVVTALFSGFFNVRNAPSKRLIFKLIGSFLFCIAGLAAVYVKGSFSSYGVFVMGALILGLLGDIFLCMKGLAADNKLMLFNALGYFCFAFGHIAFFVIFLSITSFNWYLLPVFAAVPAVLGALMLLRVINAKKLNIALLIYASFLGLMVMSAVNLFVNVGGLAGILSIVAAILFATSDLSLAMREFGSFKNKKPLIYIIQASYYIAQCLFAITIALY